MHLNNPLTRLTPACLFASNFLCGLHVIPDYLASDLLLCLLCASLNTEPGLWKPFAYPNLPQILFGALTSLLSPSSPFRGVPPAQPIPVAKLLARPLLCLIDSRASSRVMVAAGLNGSARGIVVVVLLTWRRCGRASGVDGIDWLGGWIWRARGWGVVGGLEGPP